MTALVPSLALAGLLLGQPPSPGTLPEKPDKTGTLTTGKPEGTPRKPSPFAPSLPELTDEEEAKLDAIIDRFIAADTGKLRGTEAKTAMEDFRKLGPEATFALIRGLNKSAKIEHSCPALTIARKLAGTLRSTRDTELLQFARENIGAGVERSQHMGVINDLKLNCALRQSAVEKQTPPSLRGGPGGP
jgi:hypothetical protein